MLSFDFECSLLLMSLSEYTVCRYRLTFCVAVQSTILVVQPPVACGAAVIFG